MYRVCVCVCVCVCACVRACMCMYVLHACTSMQCVVCICAGNCTAKIQLCEQVTSYTITHYSYITNTVYYVIALTVIHHLGPLACPLIHHFSVSCSDAGGRRLRSSPHMYSNYYSTVEIAYTINQFIFRIGCGSHSSCLRAFGTIDG